MKKKMPHAIVARNLRVVGVGGTVGAAAGAALYFAAPAVRRAGISLDASMAFGAAVGTAVHHSMLPAFAVVAHYRRMLELELARGVGWMTDEAAARIMQTLQERYFLGRDRVPKGFREGSEGVPKGFKVRKGFKVQKGFKVPKKVHGSEKGQGSEGVRRVGSSSSKAARQESIVHGIKKVHAA